jgi:hypothetical protein
MHEVNYIQSVYVLEIKIIIIMGTLKVIGGYLSFFDK